MAIENVQSSTKSSRRPLGIAKMGVRMIIIICFEKIIIIRQYIYRERKMSRVDWSNRSLGAGSGNLHLHPTCTPNLA